MSECYVLRSTLPGSWSILTRTDISDDHVTTVGTKGKLLAGSKRQSYVIAPRMERTVRLCERKGSSGSA